MTQQFQIDFIKILTANEIASTKSHQAGFLIPKRIARMNYFPPLDTLTKNPRVKLEILCLDNSVKVPCNFIFYNGKHLGFSTRSEYRLTGLTGFIKEMGFKVGDQVAFGRRKSQLVMSTFNLQNPDHQYFFDQNTLSSETIPFVTVNGWKIREREL